MLRGKAGAALHVRVRVAMGGKVGAEAAVRVHVSLRGKAGAVLRVRIHQLEVWLAVVGLCAKTCIRFHQRGRASLSKNSGKFLGSPCASGRVSSVSTQRETFCHKLYIQSSWGYRVHRSCVSQDRRSLGMFSYR